MKRNENRNKFKIGKSVIVTLLMAILAVSLVGCKKPVEASSEPIPSEVVSEEISEEVSEEPVSEEVSEEVVSEEPSTPQTVDEWVNSIEDPDCRITIWNDITKEGTILEREQTYVLKEGDLLVVRNELNSISRSTCIETTEINEMYIVSKFTEVLEAERYIEIEIEFETGNYVFGFYCVSEGYES